MIFLLRLTELHGTSWKEPMVGDQHKLSTCKGVPRLGQGPLERQGFHLYGSMPHFCSCSFVVQVQHQMLLTGNILGIIINDKGVVIIWEL